MPSRPRVTSQQVLVAVLVAALVVKHLVGDVWITPTTRTAATVFVAICLQALAHRFAERTQIFYLLH